MPPCYLLFGQRHSRNIKRLERTIVRCIIRVVAFVDGVLENGGIPSVLEVSVPGVSGRIPECFQYNGGALKIGLTQ